MWTAPLWATCGRLCWGWWSVTSLLNGKKSWRLMLYRYSSHRAWTTRWSFCAQCLNCTLYITGLTVYVTAITATLRHQQECWRHLTLYNTRKDSCWWVSTARKPTSPAVRYNRKRCTRHLRTILHSTTSSM